MHPLIADVILPMAACIVINTLITLWHIHELRRGERWRYLLAVSPLVLSTAIMVRMVGRLMGWWVLALAILSTSAFAQTGSPETTSAITAEINSQFPDNTTGLITPHILRQVTLDQNASYANLVTPDQTLSGGANVISNNLGTKSSGTLTIDCGGGPLQFYTNGGAHTYAAPSNDGSCVVLVTNNASAGAITFSGFNVGANTGDALDTTNTHAFSISTWCINKNSGGKCGYSVFAHQ